MNDSTTINNSKKADIFEIPHLITTISRVLRVNDLSKACRVCKRWNQIFHPFLYENIFVLATSDKKLNFKKYGHLVKALHINSYNYNSGFDALQIYCCNFEYLILQDFNITTSQLEKY